MVLRDPLVHATCCALAGLTTNRATTQKVVYSDQAMDFSRITIDPQRMAGVPCIRNLRIPVATVIDMLADGMTDAEILQAYPDLEAADIKEALRFAAEAVRERELPLLTRR